MVDVTQKQYVYNSTTGLSSDQSGTIIVPIDGGSVTANYGTQYRLTIISDHDSTTPSVGTYWNNAGDVVALGMTNTTVSGGVGIQYVFTGWSGSGTDNYTGTMVDEKPVPYFGARMYLYACKKTA